MDYRRFGKTGFNLSVFTLGTMRFLQGWDEPHHILPEESLKNCHQVLNTALGAGINLIETARGYGKSERLIGQTLPHLPYRRSDYLIMSKAPPAQTAGEMRGFVEDSLTRLGVEKLDLFALHGLNNQDRCQLSLKKGGSLDALEQMQAEGLIGAIGFSTHAPRPLLLTMLATGRFAFVNLHYYLFKRMNRAAIDLAEALDMGVLIISPNDKGGRLYTPSPALSQLTAPLHPANFNERWILSHPQIHTLSIGMSEASHIDIHLESLKKKPYWGSEEREAWAKLQEASRHSPFDLCGDCTRCLPCPQAIDIPEVFRLHHLVVSLKMDHYGQFRYDLMTPGDHWIPGAEGVACDRCGDCLPRCPQQLAIPDLLLKAHGDLKSTNK
ncbi:MAG: aldo/keto reductase [Magnetococcales bacterium]|nr:aldo/keto reductase [Magnetococcales bacterium]